MIIHILNNERGNHGNQKGQNNQSGRRNMNRNSNKRPGRGGNRK